MKVKSIAMISKNNCPACETVKEWFKERGVEIKDFNVNTHKEKREIAKLYRSKGSPGLPLVFCEYPNGKVEQIAGIIPERFKAFLKG